MDHKAAGYAASTLLFGEQSISEVDAHTPTSAIPVQDHALDLDTTQVYDLDLALVKGSCFFRGIKALFHHLFHVAPPIQLLQILHPIPKAESKWKTSERVPRYARMPEGIQLRRIHGYRKPPKAIVVARPSRWGNPYRVGDDGVPDATTAVTLFDLRFN